MRASGNNRNDMGILHCGFILKKNDEWAYTMSRVRNM